ncbi:unnamed protein product [Ilex paraguariensis]|uniref:Homeobox domain-containing protein n=1 Tax=Ilex paraguariensis TaxID=185542 RepID=A0ABC8R753_9AQUA
MEGGEGVDMSVSCGTPVGSRWNPTKEQISMLESLYKQGIRTPSAEQIQQITSRLKAYGHIEGKNVFYWFQNHKARQRQKQKQENVSYFNRYLHKASPAFPPPCPNVVCGPYYIPQSDLGFYPQYPNPKLPLPGGIRRRPRPETVDKTKQCGGGTGYEPANQGLNIMMRTDYNEEFIKNTNKYCGQETLDLFPLHPTGILQERRTASSSLASSSAENSPITTASSNPETTCINDQEGSCDQRFFEFFGGIDPCDSN